MIISELIPFDKKRIKVFIDGEFAFVLYKGELKNYKIKVGEELEENCYREIFEEVLPKRCKLRAMNLLQKRDYTEYKLREKLKDGQYPEEIIDIAVDYVKSYKYIDDERYVRDFVNCYIESRSKNRIIQDLINKGLKKDFISPIIDEIYDETNPDIELEQVLVLLKKKKYDPENADYACKQKLMSFLFRKGFSMDVIRKALALDTSYD
ncbi:MAG: recombination regulator RecX [Butyrivibrio sp.]|nr:recombination regulator RecX [Butyrivibrio sp.]